MDPDELEEKLEKLEEDFRCLPKEERYFSGDKLDFDDKIIIDSDHATKGEDSEDNSCKDQATSASREIEEEEMDPDELQGKFKKLIKMFSCLPKVLIKRILCAPDVKGNMEIAFQRLQEFRDMENPQDQFKVAMKPKPPVAEKTPRSGGDFQAPIAGFNSVKRPQGGSWDGMVKGGANAEQKSFQEEEEGKERTKKNNRQENELQGEQDKVKEQPEWRKNSSDKNEEQMDGNQLYRHQNSTVRGGFRGSPRRGPGPSGGYRGGFVQSQRDKQEYREDGFQENCGFGDNYTRQPPEGRGNWNGRGNPPKIKPKPWRGPRGVVRGGSRGGPRGGFVHVHEEYRDNVYQAWKNRGRVDNLEEDD